MTGSRYVKTPEPSEEDRPLYEATLKVISGAMTVTEAAASVGLSRVRFQTLMNRGLNGLLDSLKPQTRGPKPTPEREQALRREVEELRADNERLTKQVQASARMMGLASDYMRKGLERAPRSPRTRPTAETAVSDADDDEPAKQLEVVMELRTKGVAAPLACAAVGVSAPTARRWRQRKRQGVALRLKRGPRQGAVAPVEAKARAEQVLTDVRGCIGAAPLARASGLSRRAAAVVKEEHLTASELERRREAVRVSVVPDVVRGFDAIAVGGVPVLVSADGAIPYRTSMHVAERYDAAAVAEAVASDFAHNGAPLVWRVDRWKAHVTGPVLEVLDQHQVLLMHGPPHCPRFYGQLERQNREHRAWFDELGRCDIGRLRGECESMREAFNELVPRRTLAWRTAGAAWRARDKVRVDRRELAQEVEELKERLRKQEALRVAYPGLVERLAIQAALINRGLLRLTKGGWC